jgi:phage-related minor tail protein
MGIRKSKITPSINVDDMLKKAEISHEIETEKLDVDKRLKEICEIKETLLKIQQDLQDAIKAEGNASVVLKKAISNSNSIANAINNAIVKAEQNTEFRATIKSEHFAQLQQLLNQSVKTWEIMLENHRSKQTKMLTDHESNIRKILKRNEGIWFSDFWMKVLVIFLFVYTMVLGLIAYCAT